MVLCFRSRTIQIRLPTHDGALKCFTWLWWKRKGNFTNLSDLDVIVWIHKTKWLRFRNRKNVLCRFGQCAIPQNCIHLERLKFQIVRVKGAIWCGRNLGAIQLRYPPLHAGTVKKQGFNGSLHPLQNSAEAKDQLRERTIITFRLQCWLISSRFGSIST